MWEWCRLEMPSWDSALFIYFFILVIFLSLPFKRSRFDGKCWIFLLLLSSRVGACEFNFLHLTSTYEDIIKSFFIFSKFEELKILSSILSIWNNSFNYALIFLSMSVVFWWILKSYTTMKLYINTDKIRSEKCHEYKLM